MAATLVILFVFMFGFTTTNEIHIPVSRSIRFQLESADVIHSFWVPRLHGKKDLIPGHSTQLFLKVDKAIRRTVAV